MRQTDFLIIGNGIAGLSAAEEIRKNNSNCDITIISKDKYLTYFRPKLSHNLSSDFEIDSIFVKKAEWYDINKIELLLDSKVVEYHLNQNYISSNIGDIKYKKIIIATGSNPFIPPIEGKDKKGVFALRTYNDLIKIRNYIEDKQNISIIGGGLLGLEAAWALKKANKSVRIIECAECLLVNQLDLESSDYLLQYLKSENFDTSVSSNIDNIQGDNSVKGITVNGETLQTDAILVSTGVRPNTYQLTKTELQINRGLIIDKNMRTNIHNVYAAGDISEFNNKVCGLWTIASDQGKCAGKNALEMNCEYTFPEPFTIINLGKINIFSIGNVKNYDEVYEDKSESKEIKLFIKSGVIAGGILINNVQKINRLKKIMGRKYNYNLSVLSNFD